MSAGEVNQGSGKNLVYDALYIGRDPAQNQVVIQHPDMSRRHAVIERREGGIYLTDLNSTHGTYVEGVPVKGSVRLNPPQWIQFKSGNYFFDGNSLFNEQMQKVGNLSGKQAYEGKPLPLTETLMAPLKRGGWLKWLLGSVLFAIPIVEIFTLGYRYRLFRQGMENQSSLPAWERWQALFSKGLQMLLIRVVYMLLPTGVALLFFAGTYRKDISTGLLYTMLLTTGFAYLVVSFFMPMAMASFADAGSLGAAFKLPTILKNIGRAGKEYVLVFLMLSCFLPVIMMLVFIPYAGYPLSILVLFYVNMVAALLYGAVFGNMKGQQSR